MSKKQDTVIEEAPGLGDIEALFPPTSASEIPLAANLSMKLPVFWPDSAEVWFAQADAQFAIRNVMVSKTKFYHEVAFLPEEVAFSWRPLWCSLRASHHALHAEQLSGIRGPGIPSSLRGPETLSSDEEDSNPFS